MPERTEIARQALLEITAAATVGPLLSDTSGGEGVTTLRFEARMSGYPGWEWNVSLAELEGEEPTVLEAELVPGAGALLAPDWVPWADRMEEWRAAQAAAAEAEAAAAEDADASDGDDLDEDDLDDELADEDDLDNELDDLDDDFVDDEGHDADGDYDGVDIDSLQDAEQPDADDNSARG